MALPQTPLKYTKTIFFAENNSSPRGNYYYNGEDTIIEFNAPEAYIITLIKHPEEILSPATSQLSATATTTTTSCGETASSPATATETRQTGIEAIIGGEQSGITGASIFLIVLKVIVVLIGAIVFAVNK